jgi:tetratricopeptide (TPR) repeat protein
MKTEGGLMSFNNFLSTSLDRAVFFAFAESNRDNSDIMGVLFEITINSLISSSANVGNVSYFKGEEGILFSMNSVFHIGQVKQIDKDDHLWQVNLTLTGDNDPQLHALTKQMREETFPNLKGWHRLGNLLVKLDQFDKAQQVFDIMFNQTTEQREKANIYNTLGFIKSNQGKYEEAIRIYENSLEIQQKTLPLNHLNLATSYINIGLVYNKMGEYSKVLSYYEKALAILQKTLSADHLDLTASYNNIGTMYYQVSEYSKALSYCEHALNIFQSSLPSNHPSIKIVKNSIETIKKKF